MIEMAVVHALMVEYAKIKSCGELMASNFLFCK